MTFCYSELLHKTHWILYLIWNSCLFKNEGRENTTDSVNCHFFPLVAFLTCGFFFLFSLTDGWNNKSTMPRWQSFRICCPSQSQCPCNCKIQLKKDFECFLLIYFSSWCAVPDNQSQTTQTSYERTITFGVVIGKVFLNQLSTYT